MPNKQKQQNKIAGKRQKQNWLKKVGVDGQFEGLERSGLQRHFYFPLPCQPVLLAPSRCGQDNTRALSRDIYQQCHSWLNQEHLISSAAHIYKNSWYFLIIEGDQPPESAQITVTYINLHCNCNCYCYSRSHGNILLQHNILKHFNITMTTKLIAHPGFPITFVIDRIDSHYTSQ